MKWVSVKERLPELKDEGVIVHYENGSIEMVHIEDWVRDGLCEFNVKITHWMAAPEPPTDI